jgi:hypothetical protein
MPERGIQSDVVTEAQKNGQCRPVEVRRGALSKKGQEGRRDQKLILPCIVEERVKPVPIVLNDKGVTIPPPREKRTVSSR